VKNKVLVRSLVGFSFLVQQPAPPQQGDGPGTRQAHRPTTAARTALARASNIKKNTATKRLKMMKLEMTTQTSRYSEASQVHDTCHRATTAERL
jgi:hypothetical protein